MTIRLSIVLRFRAVDLASVSLRNPPITQLSVSSLRISAVLLSHVPRRNGAARMKESRQTNTCTIHITTGNTMEMVSIYTTGFNNKIALSLTS